MDVTLRDESNEPNQSIIYYNNATVSSSNYTVKGLIRSSREVAQELWS